MADPTDLKELKVWLDEKLDEKLDGKLDGKFTEVLTTLDNVVTRLGGVETRLGGVETRLGDVETRLGDVETRLGDVEKTQKEVKRNSIRASPSIFFRDHFIGVSSMLHPLETTVRGPPTPKTLTYCVMSDGKFNEVFQRKPAKPVALHLKAPADGVFQTDSIRKVDSSEGDVGKVNYAVMLVTAGHCLWNNGRADLPADKKSAREFWCPEQYTVHGMRPYDIGFLEVPELPSSCNFVVDLTHCDFKSPKSTPLQECAPVPKTTTDCEEEAGEPTADDSAAASNPAPTQRSKREREGTGDEGSTEKCNGGDGAIMLERAQSIFGISPSFDVVGEAAVYYSEEGLYYFVEHKGEGGNSGTLLFNTDKEEWKLFALYVGYDDTIKRGICVPLSRLSACNCIDIERLDEFNKASYQEWTGLFSSHVKDPVLESPPMSK